MKISTWLGFAGLLGWLLPIAGIPMTITGISLSLKALHSDRRKQAIRALVLNVVGLLLSIASLVAGVYAGLHWGADAQPG